MLSDILRSPSMEMDEMIPVDQFFDEYVSRLQTSAIQEEQNPYGVRGQQMASSSSRAGVVQPMQVGGGGSQRHLGEGLGTYPSESGGGVGFNPFLNPPSGYSAPLPGAVGQSSVYLDPNFFEGTPQQGYVDMYGNPQMEDPLPHDPARFQDNPVDERLYKHTVDTASVQAETSSRSEAVKKTRHKSVRQQQLNKLAQQRYRERKKAKAVGLEHTVQALTDQLKLLSTVKEEKLVLEEKNLNLERKLIEKESELQTLRNQLEEAKKAGIIGGNSGHNNSSDMTGYHQEEKKPLSVGRDSKPAQLFHKKVRDLQKYLKNNNLDPSYLVNPLDENVPKEAVDAIHRLVGDVCMTCMQLTRHDGPDLWDLISANLDSKQRESHDREMWRRIAQSLKLNNDQIMSALRLREQHLMKLESIFVQRQNLNLEAIKLLLPQEQGGRGPSAPTGFGCFNLATFIQRIRHTSKVSSVLDKLKENLSNEQKANSELEYMSFYRVMSPLQGAWFTVSAYPHQCDCLAFMNAVYELYGSRTKAEATSSS